MAAGAGQRAACLSAKNVAPSPRHRVRTVHGRLLLRPSRTLNDLVVGVIGRTQHKYAMKIHALAVLGNHAHLALTPRSPPQLASFMAYVAGNIAREVGKLHDRREKLWARRYRSIVVSHEEDAQIPLPSAANRDALPHLRGHPTQPSATHPKLRRG